MHKTNNTFKKAVLYTLVVMVLLPLLFSFFTIPAEAKMMDCPLCDGQHEYNQLSGLQKASFSWYCDVYSDEIITGTLEDALRFDISSETFQPLWNKGRGYYEAMSIFGQMLCVIYVLVSMLEHGGKSSLTPEKIFAALVKIAVAQIIISIGYDIIEAILNFSTGIYGTIPTIEQVDTDEASCYFSVVKKEDILDSIATIFNHIIPALATKGALLALNVTCWARILDIMVRVIFAPIGMADIVNDGVRSKGFRYLKQLASSAISGAVMFGVFQSYAVLVKVFSNMGVGLNATVMIILAFTLISTIFKAKNIANDMLGL